MTFIEPGSGEAVKAATHGVLFTVASACAVYGACAWWKRRERHLAVNTVLYTLLAAYETYQVTHHCRDSREHA